MSASLAKFIRTGQSSRGPYLPPWQTLYAVFCFLAPARYDCCGGRPILTEFAGAITGLLLIVYGVLSLWLAQQSHVPLATKLQFCHLLLCAQPGQDDPSSITPAATEPLALARTNLNADPASAYRWADQAEAEVDENHLNTSRYCIRQALASAPESPAILFRAARLYIRVVDYPESLKQLVKIIRNPDLHGYYDSAFSLFSSMDLPLGQVLDHALPKTPAAANAFLQFWVARQKPEEAGETWRWMAGNSLANLEGAGLYVSMLGKAGRWEEAMGVWSKLAPRADPAYLQTNWIYNGGFETKSVNSPFDWRLAPSDAAEVIRDSYTGYKDATSLFVRFVKSPTNSDPVAYQTILLTPGKWQLTAEMKTEELTGNQGLVVRIVDTADPSRLDAVTNTLTGTEEWTEVATVFQAPEQPTVARVEILRPPAEDLDVQFRGSAWVDSVTLTPVSIAGP